MTLDGKLRLFNRGAAAFERTFPGTLAEQFGQDVGPLYVCPLCDTAFTREGVTSGELTAEHVPPESFGGRVLVLTCKDCNNTDGTLLDAHAHRKERVLGILRGDVAEAAKVRLDRAGTKVAATLHRSQSEWHFEVVGKANNPDWIRSFSAPGPPQIGEPIKFEFVGDRYSELAAKTSWFRSGFLAMFAIEGYRFTHDPALAIAKRQIREPQTRLIYAFTIDTGQARPWADWLVVALPSPRCTGIVFGRYIVVFPQPGDVDFYQRLEQEVRASQGSGKVAVQTVPSYVLPNLEARFGFDIQDDSEVPVTHGRPLEDGR